MFRSKNAFAVLLTVLGMAFMAIPSIALAQGRDAPPANSAAAIKSSGDVARKSLKTYAKLQAAQNKDEPGAPPNPIILGDPFPVTTVRLDQLKQETPSTSPPHLLLAADVQRVIYPVVGEKDAKVQGGITLQKVGAEGRALNGLCKEPGAAAKEAADTWKSSAFGNKALVQALSRVRDQHATSSEKPKSAYSVVSIPALNLYFLSFKAEKEGSLDLISVFDDEALGLKAGEVYPASQLMPRIVKAAEEHDGTPR